MANRAEELSPTEELLVIRNPLINPGDIARGVRAGQIVELFAEPKPFTPGEPQEEPNPQVIPGEIGDKSAYRNYFLATPQTTPEGDIVFAMNWRLERPENLPKPGEKKKFV